MLIFLPVFRVLYMIVNAPCAEAATHEDAEDLTGKWPALEYG